jgi:toxin HigB-1
MIQSWGNRATQEVFVGYFARGVAHDVQRRAERKLHLLHRAVSLQDLNAAPSNRLEKMKGLENRWSMRINDQWRITFTWLDGHAWQVLIEDYHR